MIIKKISSISGKMNSMDIPITKEQYKDWQSGRTPVQVFFPQLSIDEREFLISGITPEEWDEEIGGEPDDFPLNYEYEQQDGEYL